MAGLDGAVVVVLGKVRVDARNAAGQPPSVHRRWQGVTLALAGGAGQGGGAAAGDAQDRQSYDPECPGGRAGVSGSVGDRSAGPRSRSAVAGRVDADQAIA